MEQSKPIHPDALARLSQRDTLPPLSQMAVVFADLVARWSERRQTRGHLSRLDQHQLRDIGIAPLDAEREAQKPFWRL